ncbi:MAG: DUF1989 domain-containing protein [Pseudomonadota bacterium]
MTKHAPIDANERREIAPVICYPPETLPQIDIAFYQDLAKSATVTDTVVVPPRDGGIAQVNAGQLWRISCPEGSQVGDMNLWNPHNLQERFFSGKTRALHGTHVDIGDRLWSTIPYMSMMATVVEDTLSWYGYDAFGGGVHDVIGTRCDPYTHYWLSGDQYHNCCHSNLSRALADFTDMPVQEAELLVHDVMNVFMCTGFSADTHQYFMKASPARQGDYITFFAEMDLLVGLSACPGGDCGDTHSSDQAQCYPLQIDVLEPDQALLAQWTPAPKNGYDRSHGR